MDRWVVKGASGGQGASGHGAGVGKPSPARAFQPLPVRGLAADRGVEREAARVRPSAHLGCDLGREHALDKAFDRHAMARDRAGQDGDGAL